VEHLQSYVVQGGRGPFGSDSMWNEESQSGGCSAKGGAWVGGKGKRLERRVNSGDLLRVRLGTGHRKK
jgi:hypothetical protein